MRHIADTMRSLSELTMTAERQIRKTAEDPPRVSVIDAIALITGHAPSICSHTLQRLQAAHPVIASCDKPTFPGRGQRPTHVCRTEQLEKVLALLPGMAAAEFRATGRNSKRGRETQTDDLYVMKYSSDNNAVKIGRSENVEKRRRNLEAGQNFFVEVVAIFPGKGSMEAEVHNRLRHYHSKKGAGREWFNITAADAALVCGSTLKEIEQACAQPMKSVAAPRVQVATQIPGRKNR